MPDDLAVGLGRRRRRRSCRDELGELVRNCRRCRHLPRRVEERRHVARWSISSTRYSSSRSSVHTRSTTDSGRCTVIVGRCVARRRSCRASARPMRRAHANAIAPPSRRHRTAARTGQGIHAVTPSGEADRVCPRDAQRTVTPRPQPVSRGVPPLPFRLTTSAGDATGPSPGPGAATLPAARAASGHPREGETMQTPARSPMTTSWLRAQRARRRPARRAGAAALARADRDSRGVEGRGSPCARRVQRRCRPCGHRRDRPDPRDDAPVPEVRPLCPYLYEKDL